MNKSGSTILLLCLLCKAVNSDVVADLPQKCVDVDKIPTVKNQVNVASGEDLNALFASAQPGTEFILQSGGYWSGPITFPTNPTAAGVEEDWIIIRSGGSLPSQGTRISPSDLSEMATIELTQTDTYHQFPAASKYVRLIGIEFRMAQNQFSSVMMNIGVDDSISNATLPNHIIIDRCWFHAPKTGYGTLKGIAVTGDFIAIIDSYFEEFKRSGDDSQAIAVYGGNGPFKIVNNYISAAGQNLLFGGVVPQPSNIPPVADIEVKYNYFYKPTSWKPGQSNYDGGAWTVRNHLSISYGRRILVEGNYFQNNWNGNELGMSIKIASDTQGEGYDMAECSNITIRYNLMNATGGALQVSNTNRTQNFVVRTHNIVFENNLGVDIGANWGGTKFFKLSEANLTDIRIQKNTMYGDNDAGGMENGKFGRIELMDNVMTFGDYGWVGTSAGGGTNAMGYYCSSYIFTNNAYRGDADVDFQAYAYQGSIFFDSWPSFLTNPPAEEYPSVVTSFLGFDTKDNSTGIGADTGTVLSYYQIAKGGVRPTEPNSKCEVKQGFDLGAATKTDVATQLVLVLLALLCLFH